MERLTDCAQGYCEVYCDNYTRCFSEPDACKRKHEVLLYERLKAYERTGMEPREIVRCSKNIDDIFKLTQQIDKKKLAHISELANAENEGRLVVLPCKVGDTLYYFPRYYAKSGYDPEPVEVTEVNYFSGAIVVKCYMDPDSWIEIIPGDFGKTVFLTREEAEAALREETP